MQRSYAKDVKAPREVHVECTKSVAGCMDFVAVGGIVVRCLAPTRTDALELLTLSGLLDNNLDEAFSERGVADSRLQLGELFHEAVGIVVGHLANLEATAQTSFGLEETLHLILYRMAERAALKAAVVDIVLQRGNFEADRESVLRHTNEVLLRSPAFCRRSVYVPTETHL